MKKIVLSILFCVCTFLMVKAQTEDNDQVFNHKKNEYEIRAGVTIGGTSPLPLPKEIQKIEHYSPEFNGMIEGQMTRWFNDTYGLSVRLRLENNGMKTTARVQSYHTKIVNEGFEVAGYWTGRVTTELKITYLTLPILVNCQLNDRWRFQTGIYVGYNLTGNFKGEVSDGYLRENTPVGQKIEFNNDQYATYDFSKNLKDFAYGVQLGGQWRATGRLHAIAQFTWGLNDIFNKDFKTISFNMFPIYLSLGAAYGF